MVGRKVLGLIPARGGSKGIPRKNIALLAGKPLIAWVCEAGQRSRLIDDLVVSSDDDEIISVARSFGVRAPFKRPAELAQDESLVIDVILHALAWLSENEENTFDYVCLLEPTSPFATASDYDRAIRIAMDKDADTVMSVYRCGHDHPAIMFTLREDARAEWYIKDAGMRRMARRQDYPSVYVRIGLVYVFKTSLLLGKTTLYGERLYAIEVPRERAVTIDTPHDLKVAELLAEEYLQPKDNV